MDKEGHSPSDKQEPGTELDDVQRARRTLLKTSLYTAPLIIGTLLISKDAQAQVPSCTPQLCDPDEPACNPIVSPCNPNRCEPWVGCGPFDCGPYCSPDT